VLENQVVIAHDHECRPLRSGWILQCSLERRGIDSFIRRQCARQSARIAARNDHMRAQRLRASERKQDECRSGNDGAPSVHARRICPQ
jgi:hypothetical protein